MGVKMCLHSTIVHRISSWRELRCNLNFLTSVRYIQSCLKGCSRLASRIFLITRTLLGGLFHVNRWLAGSWMCLGDKKPQTSPHFGVPPFWAGKNASSSTQPSTQPPPAGRGGSNSHCNDISVLHYGQVITQSWSFCYPALWTTCANRDLNRSTTKTLRSTSDWHHNADFLLV